MTLFSTYNKAFRRRWPPCFSPNSFRRLSRTANKGNRANRSRRKYRYGCPHLSPRNRGNDWLSEKMVVVNQPGAGGTIATRRIKDAPDDGYTIGLWHQGLVTSKAMGIVDYDHTAFEILCSSGYSEVGIGTGPKSRIKTYDDLLTESKRSPIKFSTNIGLPVHLAPMIFANESGVSFRFIQARRFSATGIGNGRPY